MRTNSKKFIFERSLRITAFFLALFVSISAFAQPVKTVVVISVDGLGKHLLSLVDTPAIDQFAKEGESAARAETIHPPMTVPSHISMLTGVEPDRHGITHNQLDSELTQIKVPSIFDLVKRNGLKSSAVLGKEKLKYVFDTGAVSNFRLPTIPLAGDFLGRFPGVVYREALEELVENKPSFLFVHYAMPDTMGHWFGWESWIQKLAVKSVDTSIGQLMKGIREKLEPGSYAVIFTADHGGHKGSHGQRHADGTFEDAERDTVIPWMIVGAKINSDIKLVKTYDTAATVAQLLGLPVPPEWGWQGRPVTIP